MLNKIRDLFGNGGMRNRYISNLNILAIAGKEWRDEQLKNIANTIFNKFKNRSHRDKLSFEDLYIATLLVYK